MKQAYPKYKIVIKRGDLALLNMDESLQKSKKLVAATKEDLDIAEKENLVN